MHFAASGEAALEKLAGVIEPTLILILSDINTPGMDGLTAGGNQTATPRPAGDDQRRRRASALDAFEFVNKPVDFT